MGGSYQLEARRTGVVEICVVGWLFAVILVPLPQSTSSRPHSLGCRVVEYSVEQAQLLFQCKRRNGPRENGTEWCYNDCDMMQRRAEHYFIERNQMPEQKRGVAERSIEKRREDWREHATRSEVNK